jgi:mannitol-1-/sugar-/sorbitol-6-phosphatase
MRIFTARALLLDLDGVLVDSTASITRSWAAWASRHGLDPAATFKLGHGVRTIDHIRVVAPYLDRGAEAAALEALEVEAASTDRAFAGAAGLVERLMGTPWAVVTSSSRNLAVVRLRGAGLPIPDVLVSGDDVSASKPDPEGYLQAARLLSVAPTEAIVIEDAPAGIAAARSAGAQVVAVASTHGKGELATADAVAESLEELEVTHTGAELCLFVRPDPSAGSS